MFFDAEYVFFVFWFFCQRLSPVRKGRLRIFFFVSNIQDKVRLQGAYYFVLLNKSILINQDTLDEPVLFWVSVFDCSPHRVDLKKKDLLFKNFVLFTGNIVYLTATEKEITFHIISSCNINYESNIEFKEYLI